MLRNNVIKKRKSLGVTLVELMIVMALGTMVSIAAWRLFRIQNMAVEWGREEMESQRNTRMIIEYIKNDIRDAVWSDMLLGGKFIIQEPYVNDAGQEFGGKKIKFAKFSGLDDDGKPKIEKIMYKWDVKTGQVLKGNWDGNWVKDNSSKILNPHQIGRVTQKTDGSGTGYIFFKEITYDQDEQYGLVGRTLILIGLRVDYGAKHMVELHTLVGPRFINSRDKEPFWNQNSSSEIDYKEFEK